jgi:hypothetical protein
MKRLALILAASFLLAASTAKAGELDAEYGVKTSKVPTPTPAFASGSASSELDAESPDQACCWRKRFYRYSGFGYGYRASYCGFGYGGYGGFGGGYAGLGYGGFGGYGGYGGMYW